MGIEQFIAQLTNDLRQPLPGIDAQYRMAPRPRSGGRLPYDQAPVDARHSGVLILFYPHTKAEDKTLTSQLTSQWGRESKGDQTIYLPLILRPTYDGVHSGQVAFPGGSWEEGDNDIVETALREAEEEIGIDRSQVHVIGELTPLYIYVSNHLVHPTVAWLDQRPHFEADPYEVAMILEMPLQAFLQPENIRTEHWELRDRSAEVPFFYIQKQTIWGATAMMLSELLALPSVSQYVS